MWRTKFRFFGSRAHGSQSKRRSRVILAGEQLEERSLLSAMPFPAPLSSGPQLAAEISSDSGALVAAPYALVGPDSIITTVAGNGKKTTLNQPQGVAADAKGNIYISDSWNDRVRELYKNGTIRTIRGQGAVFGFPVGLAVNPAGTVLYIAEQQNEIIHKIDLITGQMTRYAGTGTGDGYQDDGHPATQTRLVLPTDLALDKNGDLYITEGGSISPHNRIRKVDHQTHIMTTVVGGVLGLNNIGSVAVDNNLNIFFTSSWGIVEADSAGKNLRVLLTNAGAKSLAVDPTGNTVYFVQGQQVKALQGGTVTTIAGNGASGFKGDGGPASQAELYYPADIALGVNGNIYIADSWNHRIRAVKAPPGKPDLEVTNYTTDEYHSTDDTWLQATVTVVNNGTARSKPFDVMFYAKATASEYARGDLVLKHAQSGRGLNPGESMTITRPIKDPVYMNNNFTNGYYTAVHVDAARQIAETDEGNNYFVKYMADADHLAGDKSWINLALLGFTYGAVFTYNGVAAQHLAHWFDGTGTRKDWLPGSFASDNLKDSAEFKTSVERAKIWVQARLKQSAGATGGIFTDINVPSKIIGKPKLQDDLDLAFGIAGTQGSAGNFSGIRITSSRREKGHTYYTFDADLSITYYDRYTFDTADAHKRLGDYARHLEMSGWAKAFDVSISATTKVTGTFWV